ncbi:hypothetical protein LUZ62_027378 [Rhynchospora pubera]|uniref:Uncharacterized protein n=1 Tax=Rhynchospora pubera TaxID=906938 RepID=A0AAV8HFU7_9POAL|nr:hypothetical protein LUZ62_027378 [Rhynchospora pubera]
MIVKLIVWCLTSLIDLATFVVFRGGATLIICMFQLLRAPGIALGGLLDNLRSIFSAIGEYVFELIWDILSSIISGFFEFVNDVITGFFDHIFNAALEMMQLSKEGLEELFNLITEIFGGLSEIFSKLVVSILDNFQEAISSILEKI